MSASGLVNRRGAFGSPGPFLARLRHAERLNRSAYWGKTGSHRVEIQNGASDPGTDIQVNSF